MMPVLPARPVYAPLHAQLLLVTIGTDIGKYLSGAGELVAH